MIICISVLSVAAAKLQEMGEVYVFVIFVQNLVAPLRFGCDL